MSAGGRGGSLCGKELVNQGIVGLRSRRADEAAMHGGEMNERSPFRLPSTGLSSGGEHTTDALATSFRTSAHESSSSDALVPSAEPRERW